MVRCVFAVELTNFSKCTPDEVLPENLKGKKVSFTTLRHRKGTMEYHKTKDILHVQRILGHKCIESTMVYINLEAATFAEGGDDFSVKVARTVEEACKLVGVGFECVCDMNGFKIFRKRK